MRKIVAFAGQWFNRAMTEPEINSRLCFLLGTFGAGFCVTVLTLAFIFTRDPARLQAFPYMVGAVAGAGGASAWGRWLTKKAGVEPAAPPPPDHPIT